MVVNDAIVEQALEAIRVRNRGEQKCEPATADPLEPARGVCFHCGGTGRCNCIACDPPEEYVPCKGWLQ
jgi:hypothetical protein